MKNIVETIDNSVKINTVLISVSDKTGLPDLVTALIRINPTIKILSTGGTYKRIGEIIGNDAGNTLIRVSDYTGQPETQGGLVKTLDFKIYLGLLTETYNEFHTADLKRTNAVQIDMVVVNLYPFENTITGNEVSVEKARANIDIGGPTMIRASAKNYLRIASVVDPGDYKGIIKILETGSGTVPLSTRFELAKKAFNHTAEYDRCIADYLSKQEFTSVRESYSTMDSKDT